MILITGATGFIGTVVTTQLINKDHDIRILTRDPTRVRPLYPKTEIIKGDVLDPKKSFFKDVGTIIHLAGCINYSKSKQEIKRMYDINLNGTERILPFCDNKRFIFSSSVSVYGPIPKGEIVGEDYTLNPHNDYGKSKFLAEQAIFSSDVCPVILRIAPVYGAGSPIWMKILKTMDRGFPIPRLDTTTHIVHVNDVARAFLASLKSKKGVYNIADSKPIPFVDLSFRLLKLLGRKKKTTSPILARLLARLSRASGYDVWTENRHYSIKRAKKEMKFSPKEKLGTSLKEMVEWYRATVNTH